MPTPETTPGLPVSDELVRTLIRIAHAASDETAGMTVAETILLLRLAPALLEELLRYRETLGALYAVAVAAAGDEDNVVPLRRPALRLVEPTGPEAA